MHPCLLFFFLVVVLTGCRSLNPSIMMRTPKDYKYSQPPTTPQMEYRISANDVLEFRIYSNSGDQIIRMTSFSSENVANLTNNAFEYTVSIDGTVKLPLLGNISVKGLTLREAEVMLEKEYSKYYRDPFVILQVTNRRVMVFPGSEGTAKVVPLYNNNTTLMEALAIAGGIAADGKAKKVKVIRGDLKNAEVFLFDLSTIDGMKHADLVLQANDIIYVETRLRTSKTILTEITPYLSFIITALTAYLITINLTSSK